MSVDQSYDSEPLRSYLHRFYGSGIEVLCEVFRSGDDDEHRQGVCVILFRVPACAECLEGGLIRSVDALQASRHLIPPNVWHTCRGD